MNRRLIALALPVALLALLVSGQPALAKGGDQAAMVLFGPFLWALALYPIGLAFHFLILGYAPRRGMGLVSKLEDHRGKTIVLGVLNTFFFLMVAIVLGKPAPALSALAVILWGMLALVGSYGLARSLGARVLGKRPGEASDIREIALGWFVFLFAIAFPGLGLLLGAYWGIRATGGVVLTLFSVPEQREFKLVEEPPAEPPKGNLVP